MTKQEAIKLLDAYYTWKEHNGLNDNTEFDQAHIIALEALKELVAQETQEEI